MGQGDESIWRKIFLKYINCDKITTPGLGRD